MNFLCLICHDSAQKNLALCKDCEDILPYHQNKPSAYSLYFDKTVILFDYHFPVDCLITQLKFEHSLSNANLLGNLLADKVKSSYHNEALPELLIPVPLHIKRLRERGFNQSVEIAKILRKRLNILMDTSSCYRIRNTQPQSSLPRKQRLKNLDKAFYLKENLHVHHIALIDDVMTTGQTLKTLAQTLRQGRIEKIDVWCCAQTSIFS
jgi:ComF family protein